MSEPDLKIIVDNSKTDLERIVDNSETLKIIIDNNDYNLINLNRIIPYNKVSKSVMESAIIVRKQTIFPPNDVVEYKFHPMPGQLENVRLMLDRFEGKGVLGDQVGYGKTIEALLVADEMARAGAVKSVLIITANKETRKQWLDEIDSKFNNRFRIINNEDDSLLTVLNGIIKSTNDSDSTKTDTKSGGYQKAIVAVISLPQITHNKSMMNKGVEVAKYYGHIQNDEYVDLGELLKNKKWQKYPASYLSKCGFGDYGNFKPKDITPTLYDALIVRNMTLKDIDKALLALEKNLNDIFLRKPRAVLGNITDEEISSIIDGDNCTRNPKDREDVATEYNLAFKLLQGRREMQKGNIKGVLYELFNAQEKPFVDLLIVDEIHLFFEKNKSKEYIALREFLAKINKRFCVLVSATPIRTKLEDIFDLIYITDYKRLGKTEESAKEYFYRVYCGIEANQEPSLYYMATEGDINKLNGMINSVFTRKRISAEYGTPKINKEHLDSIKEQLSNINSEIYNKIKNNSNCDTIDKIVEAINEYPNEELAELYKYAFLYWAFGLTTVVNDLADNMLKAFIQDNATINFGLICYVNNHSCKINVNNEEIDLRNCINWTRPGKKHLYIPSGECINPSGKRNDYPDITIIGELFSGVNKHIKDAAFLNATRRGGLVFESNKEKRVALKILNKLEVKIDGIFNNSVYLLEKKNKVGVNYQFKNVLVLAQIDDGDRFLSPLDIEQWIGRIYRMGQVQISYIVLLGVNNLTNMYGEQAFADYYYDVLADKDGFDMFGAGDKEVGFYVPIVTDWLRHEWNSFFEECSNAKKSSEKKDKNSSNKTLSNNEDNCSYLPIVSKLKSDLVNINPKEAKTLSDYNKDLGEKEKNGSFDMFAYYLYCFYKIDQILKTKSNKQDEPVKSIIKNGIKNLCNTGNLSGNEAE